MIAWVLLSVLVADAFATRTIAVSRPGFEVNLVEYFEGRTLIGKCSYIDLKGEKVVVFYEQQDDQLTARSATPVQDAAQEVRACKEAAANSQLPATRSAQPDVEESPEQTEQRLDVLREEIAQNQQFLDPQGRIIIRGNLQNLLPTFGTKTVNVPVPQVNVIRQPIQFPALILPQIRPQLQFGLPQIQYRPVTFALGDPQTTTLPFPKPILTLNSRQAQQQPAQQGIFAQQAHIPQVPYPYYFYPSVEEIDD